MAAATQIDQVIQASPARTRTRRISSVAYAEDEMASELKIGRASCLESRSPISEALVSGLPKMNARTRAARRPRAVVGALAAALATITPGPAEREEAGGGRLNNT